MEPFRHPAQLISTEEAYRDPNKAPLYRFYKELLLDANWLLEGVLALSTKRYDRECTKEERNGIEEACVLFRHAWCVVSRAVYSSYAKSDSPFEAITAVHEAYHCDIVGNWAFSVIEGLQTQYAFESKVHTHLLFQTTVLEASRFALMCYKSHKVHTKAPFRTDELATVWRKLQTRFKDAYEGRFVRVELGTWLHDFMILLRGMNDNPNFLSLFSSYVGPQDAPTKAILAASEIDILHELDCSYSAEVLEDRM